MQYSGLVKFIKVSSLLEKVFTLLGGYQHTRKVSSLKKFFRLLSGCTHSQGSSFATWQGAHASAQVHKTKDAQRVKCMKCIELSRESWELPLMWHMPAAQFGNRYLEDLELK